MRQKKNVGLAGRQNFDFERWAAAVRAQMLDALEKRRSGWSSGRSPED